MAVRRRGKYLVIDFYCSLPTGRRVRCVESTKMKDTKANRRLAEAQDRSIQYELKVGQFDYLRHFPNGSKARYYRQGPGGMTLNEWWTRWIEEKSLRHSTYKGWWSSFNHQIAPHMGHMYLTEITEHNILAFRKALEQKGLKASYINDRIIKLLCMALLRAHSRGLIDVYPCREVRRLSEALAEIDPFSFEELKSLLDTLWDKRAMYHDMILIWSRTGLRPGEIYALKWSRVDYFNRKILVREARTRGVDGLPKTQSSIRDVDMRPVVFSAFKRQEARTGLQDSYVFLTEAGRPFSDAFMRKKFRFLLRLAGLKYRPPVNLRHTFATLHIAAGENISWVSKMLGHANVEITLKRYNRFIPNLTREDGSAFERIMNHKGDFGNIQVSALRASF